MEQLTFHLDSVVKQKGSLTDFDGPLSLILQLLSRNRVEIQDIRISEITDQYLEYLAEMVRSVEKEWNGVEYDVEIDRH